MDTPLLQTKLYTPPIRPEFVSRPRLIERLNEGLPRQNASLSEGHFARKLTLISAPAGFGKTTLASEWIAGCERIEPTIRTAWLSLDEGDNDPVRFLSYLIAALQTVEADVEKGMLSALQSPQPPPIEIVLTSLINEIAATPDRLILVLDDYHLIETQLIHDALTFLLEHLPPRMHLAIATREDPPLPLARMRARGQLTELRATDLRFTTSEAVEFLNQVMDLKLSAEDIAALETRTEGWIAGLQLAAISMQGCMDVTNFIKSFTGSHHFVLDYLIEEVLEQQPKSVQNFLLQTSILDRLTGSLCDAVCSVGTDAGQDNGQATLEMLQRANLFIVPLDEERYWYRYYHLFADLLRQRLYRQTHHEQISILHHRASEWYEQNELIDEAIEHALRGEYFERAAYLIEDQFGIKYERGEHTKLRRWLAELPEELVFSKPHLCILHAWNLFTSGQLDAADRSLRAAEKMLDPGADKAPVSPLEQDQPSNVDKMKMVGRAATIRAFLASYSGDMPGTIKYARRALEYLPEQELPWRSAAFIALGDAFAIKGEMAAAYEARSEALAPIKATGNAYLLMIANLKLAEILRQQGKLQQVIEICEQQIQYANESGISETVVAGWLLAIWGEVLAELNDLDGAIHKAKKGTELTGRSREVAMVGWSNLCLVRVLFSRGDMTGAKEVIQEMEKTAREYDMPLWVPVQLSAWKARIWLAEDKQETVSQWAGGRRLDTDGDPKYLHEVEYIVLARILIAQRWLDEAVVLLQRLLKATEAGGRTARVVEIMILQALAAQAGGDTARAMTTLEQALSLAEPEGFIRIFVDEGLPMARLLYEAITLGIAPDYARRLLAAFPVAEPEPTDFSKTQVPKSELVEPLSEREFEVLQLIAEGLTNPEIAAKLFLSLHTIKSHARNIYGKLGVHNRTQAVTRARSLGLLSST